jgi:hypothetical protein
MRIYVYKSPLMDADEFAELIAMLDLAGFTVVVIEALADDAIAGNIVFEIGDVVFVLMTEDIDSDTRLAALCENVARVGGRIVGVWPKVATGQDIASAVEWHGSAVIPWNVQRLADAVRGEDVWETPTGEKRLAPHTERHKC